MKLCPDCNATSSTGAKFCGQCGRDISHVLDTMPTKLASTEAAYDPVCPHCDHPFGEIHWRSIKAVNAEYIFMCPKCRKVIGVAVRKASWIN